MRVQVGQDPQGRAMSGEIILAVFDHMSRPLEALVRTDDGQQLRFGFDESGGFRFASWLEVRNPAWGDKLLQDWTVRDQHPADERHTLFNTTLRILGENEAALDGHRLYLMGWQLVQELVTNPFEGTHDGAMSQLCETCNAVYPHTHRCEHLRARDTQIELHNRSLLERVRARNAGRPAAQVSIRARHD